MLASLLKVFSNSTGHDPSTNDLVGGSSCAVDQCGTVVYRKGSLYAVVTSTHIKVSLRKNKDAIITCCFLMLDVFSSWVYSQRRLGALRALAFDVNSSKTWKSDVLLDLYVSCHRSQENSGLESRETISRKHGTWEA